MIISNIVGGLGNQMFQYAAGRRLAFVNETDLLIDSSGYTQPAMTANSGSGNRRLLLFNFRIRAREASESEKAALRDKFRSDRFTHRAVRFLRRAKSDLLWPRSHIVEGMYRFDPAILS